MTKSPTTLHPAALMYAEEAKAGKLSRREFMARATALGVTVTAAYGLIGVAAPAQAAGHVQQGGTMRVQMEVRALKDPRVFDWPQIAYVTAGWLEHLVDKVRSSAGRNQPGKSESLRTERRAERDHLSEPAGVDRRQGGVHGHG